MKVLDLFAGMGGFSYGLARAGYTVTGVDINPWTGEIFKKNKIGNVLIKDLNRDFINDNPDIITGGPPCRPWSTLNIRKRHKKHEDYSLLERFFEHIFNLKPRIFIFENVPAIRKDSTLASIKKKLTLSEFHIMDIIINYSYFGAATSRKRYFLFGFYRNPGLLSAFSRELSEHSCTPQTVEQAIGKFRYMKEKETPDHEWPKLKTIHKYKDKYRTGKFGWAILEWDKPAPSFGNVMKTYILHPDGKRVISIREALAIFGFGDDFSFPEGMGKGIRYQMVADTVSPMFSFFIGNLIKKLTG